MAGKPPSTEALWFRRSLALTLAVGAVLCLLVAARPGYGAFFVSSTLAFLLAGFLWSPGEPPARGLRVRLPERTTPMVISMSPARSYRISTAR